MSNITWLVWIAVPRRVLHHFWAASFDASLFLYTLKSSHLVLECQCWLPQQMHISVIKELILKKIVHHANMR